MTYVLGYYPAHGQRDGKFREIKVQVKRPGLCLRYRGGYLRRTYEEVLNQGVTLSRNLPIAAGAAKLRVIVRDATSGSIGSISIPLDKLFPNSS